MIMDEIFGIENFKNELVWCYKGGNATTKFRRKHDTILFYTKSSKYLFNADATRRPYSGEILAMAQQDSSGRLYYDTGQNKERKIYLHPLGQLPYDWWDDIPSFTMAHGKEYSGYPTQKPLALLERIIKASSNKDDTILDPFCGCGTAIIAAQELGRNWIGIDISKDAYRVSKDRYHQLTFDSTFGQPEPKYIERMLDDVLAITDTKEFEEWVNYYFKATKPYPDKGVDGITQDGVPIQTKTNEIKEPVLHQFLHQITTHPKVPQPVKRAIAVSKVGFDDNARQLQFLAQNREGIIVELLTPTMMLNTRLKE